jgi:hypothetical protein
LNKLWVPVVLLIAAFAMSGTITAHHSDALSPVDEWVYVDYLYKLPEQGIVHQGEKIGKEALNIMACDGVKPYGPMGPACGTSYADLSKFPFKGVTSADAYTPVYFAITRVVGDAIHAATGIDQLTAWRLTGSLWLALTVSLLYLLMRQWRVPRWVSLGLGLAFIASPFSWWTYSYVSTDAPSVALGVLLLYAAVKFSRGQWSGWWVVAISTAAVIFKVTNILAVCLAALYLLIVWLLELRRTRWSVLTTRRPDHANRASLALPGLALMALAMSGAAQVAWLAIRRALALGVPPDQAIGIPLTVQEIVSQIVNFLPGTITANVNLSGSTNLAYPIPPFVVEPLAWVCIAGVLGAFWTLKKKAVTTPLIVSITIAALFFAPMLAVILQLFTGAYFPLPPRYGAPILGAFLLAAGMMVKNNWATGILVGYSIALYATVLITAPLFA